MRSCAANTRCLPFSSWLSRLFSLYSSTSTSQAGLEAEAESAFPATAISYLIGAIGSGLAGFIGMSIAVRANTRTAVKAMQGLNPALRVAFNSGAVMGVSVVGIGLLGVSILYLIFQDITVVAGFGFGASSIALFARVGGGIYTKAADVGADLVGKVEQGIPEDDPRVTPPRSPTTWATMWAMLREWARTCSRATLAP